MFAWGGLGAGLPDRSRLATALIAAVLRRHHVGRLAGVVAGEPYLVPVTYAYQDGVLYGQTGPGTKLAALRADLRVAFEVDERWETDVWRSVVARSVFEELADEADRPAAADAQATAYPDVAQRLGAGVFFRIRPMETTGRLVRRAALFRHLADLDAPLLGIDLRAGDELNFPSRAAEERRGQDAPGSQLTRQRSDAEAGLATQI